MDARLKPETDASAPDATLLREFERRVWASRFAEVRGRTRDLVAPLSPEDQQVQSMPDASPTKWHLAHTAWFFETFVLTPHQPDYVPIDARYAYLFNSYYEAVGERHPRPQRGLITRPTAAQVLAYRTHVDAAMTALIETASEAAWPSIRALIELGLHHEQQHQELILMDIKHAFSCNPLRPALHEPSPRGAGSARPVEWLRFAGGLHEIGHAADGFAFDNETPRHKVWLECFDLADRLSTTGEYLAFIHDGGYARSELWLSDGWAAVQREGWRAPLYWREGEDGWRIFTLEGERAVDAAEPVCHLSFYEADAFARWSGGRLPTEAEWEVAAALNVKAANDPDDSAVGLAASHHPRAAQANAGLRQMSGAVWQWTGSAYLPYPGFAPPTGAVGEYNGKFMSGQMVLRGGACVTPPGHTRITYRNFFPPEARWAFSGVRLARNV
jgi:ergothioneine biosynthesis protein EgtB